MLFWSGAGRPLLGVRVCVSGGEVCCVEAWVYGLIGADRKRLANEYSGVVLQEDAILARDISLIF